MGNLRWVKDEGDFWDLDVSTPSTLDGVACPAPGDPLPLGISRGTRLSRPKQLDFMQRLLNVPLLPVFSKSQGGLAFQRVHTLPINHDGLLHFLGQFNLQKLISSVKSEEKPAHVSSWLKSFGRQLRDKSVYAIGLFSEFKLTPDDVLHLGLDYTSKPRAKAVLCHKFPHHDLTVEAVYPGLFVEKTGKYWDVPFSMAIDIASEAGSDSSSSYHLSAHYNAGTPEPFDKRELESGSEVPQALLQGLALKNAYSYRKKVDIWRSEAPKLESVQPYYMFLSNPQVSASGTIGAAATTFFGENAVRELVDDGSRGFYLYAPGMKSAFLANMFASASLTAQLGNFQKRFLDLTRLQAQLQIPSGYKFLAGAKHLAVDFFNNKNLDKKDLQAICPTAALSFQQQIAGPVSFRVDSGIKVNLVDPNNSKIQGKEPVFALEWALQKHGSAKAVAWYCPQRQEIMAELRFYEK